MIALIVSFNEEFKSQEAVNQVNQKYNAFISNDLESKIMGHSSS